MKTAFPESLALSDRDAQTIFQTRIVPDIGAVGPAVRDPTLTIVSGPIGSGKTSSLAETMRRFESQTTQSINIDKLSKYVPGYNEAAKSSPVEAWDLLGNETSGWVDKLTERAFEKRANIVLETAHSPDSYSTHEDARAKGYRTELYVIATKREMCFAGMLDRFDKALSVGDAGSCALVDREESDQSYSEWPRTVFEAEEQKQFDRIVIAHRDGSILYENDLVSDGSGRFGWKNPPRALEALLIERHNPMRESDRTWLSKTWGGLRQSPRLKEEPFADMIPLSEHHAEVKNWLSREGQFHPLDVESRDQSKAAKDFLDRLDADLDLTLESQDEDAPPDPNFTNRIHLYRNSVREIVRDTVGKSNTLLRQNQTLRLRPPASRLQSISCNVDHSIGKEAPSKRSHSDISAEPTGTLNKFNPKRVRLDERTRDDCLQR